ncbi:hypothetical protein [Chitinophaga sp. SYP-B3965]|uniref:hypothetical protein n=1 Tax=Chitinophaga sp. SYP-B3965 TaxID=2663120 RepID=UPI001564219E|nr:hypothetical protein [Chitinophaga sp. SYP-B3965]
MKKIRVKLTGFWQSDEQMLEMVKMHGFGRSDWKNVQFTDGAYDKLIILTRPFDENMDYDEKKAMTFLTEPLLSNHIREHKTSVILPLSLFSWSQAKPANYQVIIQQGEIKKSELLSSVTSDLYDLEGHEARLDFIQAFDRIIEDGFDLWGRNNSGLFFQGITAYRGAIEDKFDALLKYRYHINCENSFCENYFTEKITDPILAETLCFYDGCTNISSFIDERAYVKLNIRAIQASIDTIIELINMNAWRKRIPYIRKQKLRLLTDLNPLNIIWMAVNDMDVVKECTL